MKIIRTLSLAVAASFFSATVIAQSTIPQPAEATQPSSQNNDSTNKTITATSGSTARWYQVNIIIFSQINEKSFNSEQWPLVDTTQMTKHAILITNNTSNIKDIDLDANNPDISQDITPNSNQDQPPLPSSIPGGIDQTNLHLNGSKTYHWLPDAKFQLEKELFQLQHNKHYAVILHGAWLMPFFKGVNTPAVQIKGGQIYDGSGNPIQIDPNQTNASNNPQNSQALKMPLPQDAVAQLNGIIKITLTRYLNVKMNLLFAEPVTKLAAYNKSGTLQSGRDGLFYFRLLQTRRMKSDELNYIDNPLYGVIIKIMRASGPESQP